MATRKKKSTPEEAPAGPAALRPGMPTRLLPHDWPFLYSVVDNGDLVINKRLPLAPASIQTKARRERCRRRAHVANRSRLGGLRRLKDVLACSQALLHQLEKASAL